MKKISLIVMCCIIACGLFANHGIVKGGEMMNYFDLYRLRR